MAKSGYVNTRIDHALKARAEKVFSQIGVTTSQAVTMFFRQVVLRRGIPFDVCIPNEATQQAMAELDAGGGTTHTGPTADVFDDIVKGDAKRRA
jgi:DNA-damage-inducible protein J